MKIDMAFYIWASACALGCVPKSDNAGDLLDTGVAEGTAASDDDDDGDTGESLTATTTSAGDPSTGGSAGDTGPAFPAACESEGWVSAYDTFTEMAAAADHTYWYRVLGGNFGNTTGLCLSRTTIVVEQAEVVRRIFENLGPPEGDPDGECEYAPFVEEQDELGTHEPHQASAAWTLEQLYVGCCEEVLTRSVDEYSIAFGTDAQGMLDHCSYSPLSDCTDGCAGGPQGYGRISIDSMGFGALPPD